MVALMLGMGRGAATEFSFLLGVPTLCAAGALKLLESFKAHGAVLEHEVGAVITKTVIPMEWGPLIVACVAASISSVFAVRWMLRYVSTHTFTGFGVYRILVGVLLLAKVIG